jgi:heptosyltransferase I
MNGRPVATIVPATATIKKDWLAERWARIAEALESDYGFAVVIAGGPGDREQAVGREITARSAASITWAMSDSVRRLSYVIDGSDLVIAPDTGPVHIARALDVPVIGLYGHTNPWRVGPWRAYQDLWVDRYTEPGTAPDPSNRTPKWDRMPTITVDDVIARIEHAVAKYDVGRKARRG